MKKYILMIGALMGIAWTVEGGTLKDGPHAGFTHGGDVHESDIAFGWQVAYEFTPNLSAELSITRQRDRIDFQVLPPPLQSTFRLETYALALSGRVGHRVGRFHFYGAGGVGYYFMRSKERNVRQSVAEHPEALPPGASDLQLGADVDDAFAFHIGAGVEIILARDWEVFVDYRWVFLDTDVTFRQTETFPDPRPNAPHVIRETTTTSSELDYEHGLFRVGLNYRF